MKAESNGLDLGDGTSVLILNYADVNTMIVLWQLTDRSSLNIATSSHSNVECPFELPPG